LLSENRQNKLNFSKEDVNHVCKIATLLKQDISKLRLQSLFAEYGLCSIRSSMAWANVSRTGLIPLFTVMWKPVFMRSIGAKQAFYGQSWIAAWAQKICAHRTRLCYSPEKFKITFVPGRSVQLRSQQVVIVSTEVTGGWYSGKYPEPSGSSDNALILPQRVGISDRNVNSGNA